MTSRSNKELLFDGPPIRSCVIAGEEHHFLAPWAVAIGKELEDEGQEPTLNATLERLLEYEFGQREVHYLLLVRARDCDAAQREQGFSDDPA